MKNFEDLLFKEALKENDLLKLKKISKADVHNHSVLRMRFATFKRIFGLHSTSPPVKIDGIGGLDEYINKDLAKHVTTLKQLEMLLESTIFEAIDDGMNSPGLTPESSFQLP